VRLNILIGAAGSVERVSVFSGHPLLNGAAQAAVRQWMYPPQAVPALIEVSVPFRLPRD
jgi:TonB family protein